MECPRKNRGMEDVGLGGERYPRKNGGITGLWVTISLDSSGPSAFPYEEHADPENGEDGWDDP